MSKPKAVVRVDGVKYEVPAGKKLVIGESSIRFVDDLKKSPKSNSGFGVKPVFCVTDWQIKWDEVSDCYRLYATSMDDRPSNGIRIGDPVRSSTLQSWDFLKDKVETVNSIYRLIGREKR